MPVEYPVTPLGEIAHIEMGQSPDSATVRDGEGIGVPFLQGNAEFGSLYPSPHFTCLAPMKMCKAGDILISVRAPVGAINIADRDYCIGRGLAAVRIEGMTSRLAAHVISAAAPALRRVAQGTTFEAINKADLASLMVKAPTSTDRAPLSQFLDTLDTTIRQTEAIIAKLKQVKQGLLNDLLTRGIDANGQLRPPQSEAPHLYKASPLGWIPLEWEVGPLESFLERIIDYRGKTPEKTKVGVTLITARNVRLGFLDPEPQEFIHESAFDSWMTRGIPKLGDILFTMEAPLGNVAQIERDERLAFAQRLVIMQTAQGVSSAFLKYLLLSEGFRKKLFALGSGSTVEGIQQSTLRRIPIALPTSLNEQDLIGRRLSELDRRIDSEAVHMAKGKSLNSGLMDDLLTGRVRVTPLLEPHAT